MTSTERYPPQLYHQMRPIRRGDYNSALYAKALRARVAKGDITFLELWRQSFDESDPFAPQTERDAEKRFWVCAGYNSARSLADIPEFTKLCAPNSEAQRANDEITKQAHEEIAIAAINLVRMGYPHYIARFARAVALAGNPEYCRRTRMRATQPRSRCATPAAVWERPPQYKVA
jgi:hypothetical protein